MRADGEMEKIMMDEIPRVVCETHSSSYEDLPPYLQRCFAFCSIFPEKWKFEREKLAKMWVALGFIAEDNLPSETGNNRDSMIEERAVGYFDDLEERSLLQKAGNNINAYAIDKHIHSMLRMKACGNYFQRMDGSGGRTNEGLHLLKARHLAITTRAGSLDKVLKSVGNLAAKKLRTLLVFRKVEENNGGAGAFTIDDGRILKEFEGVRVMDLSHTGIAEVPGSIGVLKHVRYLGLPRSVRKVSAEVNKLLLMRYLYLSKERIAEIPGIGGLQMLRGPVEFHVGTARGGHTMRELEKLNSVRWELRIKGLEAVGSKREAEKARLGEKEDLKVLKLEWAQRSEHNAQSCSDSSVIEGLKPHRNLLELHITGYLGKDSPDWLADAEVLQKLTSLYLSNCRKLEKLPAFGNLLCLEVLVVQEMPSVEEIDGTFYGSRSRVQFKSLKEIELHDMRRLTTWDEPTNGRNPFPNLTKVVITSCPRLEISSLPAAVCSVLSSTATN